MGEVSLLAVVALSMIIGAAGAFGVRAGLAAADAFEALLGVIVRRVGAWWAPK